MSLHIESNKEDIASRVIMPGDPKRAYYIAKNFLEDVKLVNEVRCAYAYTGKYKGTKVTIFASGMGIGSMGIYSHELFNDYDVDTIIRVGTAGSYVEELNISDVFLATSSYSISNFDVESGLEDEDVINSSFEINDVIDKVSEIKRIPLKKGRVHTTDAFYGAMTSYDDFTSKGCMCVEMESYALFYNAKKYHKKASTILTITDNLLTKERMDTESRVTQTDKMITLALDSIIKL